MKIDFLTLMVVAVANLFMMSVMLPFIMGRHISAAARCAQASLLLQMFGWGALIASGYWFDGVLSTLSMTCMAAGLFLTFRALAGWLGPRPGERLMPALAVLMPVGYALAFGSYPVRVGWSNFLLAAMLLLLARASLYPVRDASRRWRFVFLGCFAVMAVLTAARGVLGAFFTELYPSFRTPHPVNIAAALATNVTLVLGVVAMLVAWREEVEGKLRLLANTDSLTGILNRRGWNERAESMFANAQRYRLPLTLVMIDLDHFKRVNDEHGHEAGDQALRLFARLLRETRRTGDLIGRLGGEEFCVVLSNAQRNAATGFDQRLRSRLAQVAPQQLGFSLDYSAGVAVLRDADATLAGLLARADTAMYQAKHDGRGRLVFSAGGAGDTVI
jgi:diguanylate cyclase (GGDEF)-like protein